MGDGHPLGTTSASAKPYPNDPWTLVIGTKNVEWGWRRPAGAARAPCLLRKGFRLTRVYCAPRRGDPFPSAPERSYTFLEKVGLGVRVGLEPPAGNE